MIEIPPAVAYTLAGSIILNLALVAWTIFRGVGPKRLIFIHSAGTIIPKALKMGQKDWKWTRPDKTIVAVPLTRQYANPYGKRGTCWILNDETGELAKWDFDGKRLPFDHNYYAQALEDKREIKWFQGQRDADKLGAAGKPMLILLVLGVAAFFLFQKFGG